MNNETTIREWANQNMLWNSRCFDIAHHFSDDDIRSMFLSVGDACVWVKNHWGKNQGATS